MTQPWDNLAEWLASYDPQELDNEADVEVRFVQPLFRLLGYADEHLRAKRKSQSSKQRKKGRPPEADLTYYAYPEKVRQTPDTTLVIVEAKHPNIQDLKEAIIQARSYAEHLKPLLIVVTNGKRLVILRRHRIREDERVIDAAVSDFNNADLLKQLYELLNFATVYQQHEQRPNELRHAQYVELERALRAYPDIQELLARGDFATSPPKKEGQTFSISKPKIALTGKLPLAFGEGSCEIRFSNLLRSGLTIHLSHRDLLGSCMQGLGDQPEWNTRCFIKPEPDGSFFVDFGHTTMFLSETEAADLCACIDEFCGLYRDTIIEAEELLETWAYSIASTFTGPGFHILSVPIWLWKLVREFGEQFHCWDGNSPWHIFEHYAPALRVVRPDTKIDQTFVYSDFDPEKIQFINDEDWMRLRTAVAERLQDRLIHLIYAMPETALCYTVEETKVLWKKSVGEHGIWTARKTHQWLVSRLLPEVFKYYGQRSGHTWGAWQSCCIPATNNSIFSLSPRSTDSASALAPYLHMIHNWLSMYEPPCVAYLPFYNCFAACLALARRADPNKVNLYYATPPAEEGDDSEELDYLSFQHGKNPTVARQVFAEIIEKLPRRSEKLRQNESIERTQIVFMLRRIYIILEEGKIDCGQAELRAAQDAIEPLWQEARFYMRHVWPVIQRS